jgi:cell division initiation protein
MVGEVNAMDRIMPIDLERAQLRKSLFGYGRKDTDKLIEGAARHLQTVLVENDQLRREIDLYRAEIEKTRAQEDTLKEALVLAQKTADETRAMAQRHAESTLEETRLACLAERAAVQQRITEMRWEVERLKVERTKFAEEFKTLLERYMRDIEFLGSLTVIDGDAQAEGA